MVIIRFTTSYVEGVFTLSQGKILSSPFLEFNIELQFLTNTQMIKQTENKKRAVPISK
jgi:hypothetical protein